MILIVGVSGRLGSVVAQRLLAQGKPVRAMTRTPLNLRMIQATNQHDLDAMVACFAPDFRSEQPFHPERAFNGQAGVRKNWSFFFTTVPDMRVDILNEVAEGDTVWAELHFHGTQTDGKKFTVKGVTLQGIQADLITWTRLYIEPVQELHEEIISK